MEYKQAIVLNSAAYTIWRKLTFITNVSHKHLRREDSFQCGMPESLKMQCKITIKTNQISNWAAKNELKIADVLQREKNINICQKNHLLDNFLFEIEWCQMEDQNHVLASQEYHQQHNTRIGQKLNEHFEKGVRKFLSSNNTVSLSLHLYISQRKLWICQAFTELNKLEQNQFSKFIDKGRKRVHSLIKSRH